MKKFGKIKLQDATVLNEGEMKKVVGGYGDSSGFICYCHSSSSSATSGVICWSDYFSDDSDMHEAIDSICHNRGGYCEKVD